MPKPAVNDIAYEVVELEGVRYAMLRESVLRELCRRAGVGSPASADGTRPCPKLDELDLDRKVLADRLIARRQRAGLTQAGLARRAGIRVETLNRLERGKTTPDFSTVRKLVEAMNAAEIVGPADVAGPGVDNRRLTNADNDDTPGTD